VCAAFIEALFFRELLAVFQGNDLVTGILLAHSVFAFSCGIFISSKIIKNGNPVKTIQYNSLITAFFLIFSYIFITNIRNILNISLGGGISLKSTFIYIFFAVFPVFFIQGITFFCGIKAGKNVLSVKSLTLLICFGAAAGGICFGGFMYSFLSADITLITSALLCMSAVPVSASSKNAKIFFAVALIPSFCGLFLDTAKIDEKLLENNFNFFEIVEYKYTSYGQTAMVQKNGEYALLVNNIIQFSYPDNDILNSEDFGHIPALYPENPSNVLLIGGAAKYLPKILEHEVKRVDYLEPDAAVVNIMKNNISHLGYAFNDARVRIHNEKARKFLGNSDVKYDLILVGMPSPLNFQLNSFYTGEFFQAAKKSMRHNGFIALKLAGTMAFSTYIMAELNKSVMDAMKSVFKYSHIIPGSQNILIASDRRMPYRLHIKKRLYKMQETTLVLSKYYLDDRMDTEKTRWLRNELDKIESDETLINSDWNPQAKFLSVIHSQSAFSPYLSLFMNKLRKYSYFILLAVIIVFFLSKSVYETTAFVSGASSMWIFITILFTTQILSGEIYRLFGILAALFILGVSLGIAYCGRTTKDVPLNERMFHNELLFLCLIVFLLALFKFYNINLYVISALFLSTGFAAGVEFLQLIKIAGLLREKNSNDLRIYFSQTVGALFSALAGGGFLIVVWGMEKALLFILFMKFLIFCRWADFKKRGL
jgi:spermidine synthase